MDPIMEKKQIRSEKLEEAEGIINQAKSENRNMTTEEEKKYQDLKAEAQRLNREIEELEEERENDKRDILKDIEGTDKSMELRTFGPDEEFKIRNKDTKKNLDLGKYVRGLALGNWSNAREEKRAMGQSDATAGGYLVPDVLAERVIEKSRKRNTATRAGARTVELPHGNISLAKIINHPEVEFKEENAKGPETQITLGRSNMSLWTIYGIVTASEELIQDARNLGDLIENELADSVAEKMDYAVYSGTGAGQPLGILNNDDVLEYSLGNDGAKLSDSDFYDPWSLAAEKVRTNSNVDPEATVYSPRTAGALERSKDNNGQYLQTPDFWDNLSKFNTNQIPNDLEHGTADNASVSVVGKFNNVLIGVHPDGMRIKVSQEAGEALERNQYKVAVAMRIDALATVPNELCKITGILPETEQE